MLILLGLNRLEEGKIESPPQKLSEIQKQAKQLQGQKWVSVRELAVYREAVSNSSSNPPSSSPLSQPSTPKTEGTAAWPELQQTDPHASSSQRGSGVVVDFMSCHLRDRTDWILNPSLFSLINQMWGPLQLDLFATRFSCQLPRFFSWPSDLEAEATDAFCQDWENLAYAHPPWCLINQVLAKTLAQKVTLVLCHHVGQHNHGFLNYGNAGGFSACFSRSNPIPSSHTFPQL